MGGVPKKSRVAMSFPDGGGPSLRWIKTMRDAGGLSMAQLGAKLGIKGNSVFVAERREASGGISIYQLQRIAAAMECDLFYAFVPRQQAERPSKRYAARLCAREALAVVAEAAAVAPGVERPLALQEVGLSTAGGGS